MERSADWMDQARSDLEHARHDRAAGYHEWACFSAQQSAEKAVKAVFQKMGGEAWGHSVADLIELLTVSIERGDVRAPDSLEVSEDLLDGALELDKAYIPARYPDAHPSGSPRQKYTTTEAGRLIDHADQILRFCERALAAL